MLYNASTAFFLHAFSSAFTCQKRALSFYLRIYSKNEKLRVGCWRLKDYGLIETSPEIIIYRQILIVIIVLSSQQLKQKIVQFSIEIRQCTYRARTSFWTGFWGTRFGFWVSPGERALWIPPLWFSLMEKSRDVRGLGRNSFLGLTEVSLILQSGNTEHIDTQRVRILRAIVSTSNNVGSRKRKY